MRGDEMNDYNVLMLDWSLDNVNFLKLEEKFGISTNEAKTCKRGFDILWIYYANEDRTPNKWALRWLGFNI